MKLQDSKVENHGEPMMKQTAKAPENRLGPKRKQQVVFQPSIFKCHVSFREGISRIGIVSHIFLMVNSC